MITAKINLLQLKCSVVKMKMKSGSTKDCVVIHIELNNLYVGGKGVYLDMVGFEIRNPRPDSKDTHLIKQSLPKSVRDTMTEEEKNNQPILGNLSTGSTGSSESVSSSTPIDEGNDLPF